MVQNVRFNKYNDDSMLQLHNFKESRINNVDNDPMLLNDRVHDSLLIKREDDSVLQTKK